MMDEKFIRIAKMLESIEPGLDYPNNTYSKAQVMRARLGSIEPPMDERQMLAVCDCGWTGDLNECDREEYDNGKWGRNAGRRGYHWNCPRCKSLVWRYYHTIN